MNNETHDMHYAYAPNPLHETHPQYIPIAGPSRDIESLDIRNPVRVLSGDDKVTRTVQVYKLDDQCFGLNVVAVDIANMQYLLYDKSEDNMLEHLRSDEIDADLYYLQPYHDNNHIEPVVVHYIPVGEPVDIELRTPPIKYSVNSEGQLTVIHTRADYNTYNTYDEAKRASHRIRVSRVMRRNTDEMSLRDEASELDIDDIYLTARQISVGHRDLIGWSKDLGVHTVARVDRVMHDGTHADKLTFPCGDSVYLKIPQTSNDISFVMSEYVKALLCMYPENKYVNICIGRCTPSQSLGSCNTHRLISDTVRTNSIPGSR